MKKETMVAGGLVTLTAVAALMLAPVAVQAAGSGPAGPSTAVKFEKVPGSHVKRVILTARAVERLGIKTGKIGEQRIIRKQMVGGQVTHPLRIQAEQKMAKSSFGGFAQPAVVKTPAPVIKPAAGETWVRVTLSQEEWDRVAKNETARLMPLATRPGLKKEVAANLSKMPPIADRKRSMLNLYYVVEGKGHGLKVNERMRVELQLTGTKKKRMVVPYSAVYYDGKGEPWVYTTAKKLTYERKRVTVDRVVGGLAVLNDGPPVGTEVVTTGSSLLFGAEVIYKR